MNVTHCEKGAQEFNVDSGIAAGRRLEGGCCKEVSRLTAQGGGSHCFWGAFAAAGTLKGLGLLGSNIQRM